MPNMPDVLIDWANVNWLYVAILSGIAFLSTLISTLAFRAAVISALLFAAGFVFWTYYPHGLPLPTFTVQKAPATPAAPNGGTISPPSSPLGKSQ